MMNYEDTYQHYINLLNMSYDEVIVLLNKQYGKVTDNYYKEKSYNKFLNGEIKFISKGSFLRKNIKKREDKNALSFSCLIIKIS